nr:unnamed protein product [Callosobruchus chinensis]
MPNASLNK